MITKLLVALPHTFCTLMQRALQHDAITCFIDAKLYAYLPGLLQRY
jgi:hypothetical protein